MSRFIKKSEFKKEKHWFCFLYLHFLFLWLCFLILLSADYLVSLNVKKDIVSKEEEKSGSCIKPGYFRHH